MNEQQACFDGITWVIIEHPAVRTATMSVQITGAEVQNYCYFDGAAYSPGASICDPLYAGRVLTCQPKNNKLPVPPGAAPNTATLTSPVAGWSGYDDAKCTRK
jgi:hypothetical protein